MDPAALTREWNIHKTNHRGIHSTRPVTIALSTLWLWKSTVHFLEGKNMLSNPSLHYTRTHTHTHCDQCRYNKRANVLTLTDFKALGLNSDCWVPGQRLFINVLACWGQHKLEVMDLYKPPFHVFVSFKLLNSFKSYIKNLCFSLFLPISLCLTVSLLFVHLSSFYSFLSPYLCVYVSWLGHMYLYTCRNRIRRWYRSKVKVLWCQVRKL